MEDQTAIRLRLLNDATIDHSTFASPSQNTRVNPIASIGGMKIVLPRWVAVSGNSMCPPGTLGDWYGSVKSTLMGIWLITPELSGQQYANQKLEMIPRW